MRAVNIKYVKVGGDKWRDVKRGVVLAVAPSDNGETKVCFVENSCYPSVSFPSQTLPHRLSLSDLLGCTDHFVFLS